MFPKARTPDPRRREQIEIREWTGRDRGYEAITETVGRSGRRVVGDPVTGQIVEVWVRWQRAAAPLRRRARRSRLHAGPRRRPAPLRRRAARAGSAGRRADRRVVPHRRRPGRKRRPPAPCPSRAPRSRSSARSRTRARPAAAATPSRWRRRSCAARSACGTGAAPSPPPTSSGWPSRRRPPSRAPAACR